MADEPDLNLPPLTEMRAHARKRVLLSGAVVHDEGRHAFACTIRDLTESSARITIPRRYLLPTDLYLIKIKAGIAHRVRVVWSGEKEAGLCLLNALDLDAPDELRLNFLRDIWVAHSPR